MCRLVCVFVVCIQLGFLTTRPKYDTAYLFMQASQRFCQDVATEQLMNIEGEAIYPSASASLHRGSYTRDHFIGNLFNEPLASLINLI